MTCGPTSAKNWRRNSSLGVLVLFQTRTGRSALLLGLLLLAGGLRFHKLDWPFANDELATLAEERCLFGQEPASAASQLYRLPRIIPLAYALQHGNDVLFGSGERGSRMVTALLGTLMVGLVFLALDYLQGRPTAVAAALLLTFWPEHIFQCQQTRFYMAAAFFSALSLALGGLSLKRRSPWLLAAACAAAFAAMLCHTHTALVFVLLGAGTLAGFWAARQRVPRSFWIVLGVTAVLVGGFGVAYLLPLLRGWNQNAPWGYSVSHSLLASINTLSWPVAVLAILGGLGMVQRRSPQNWYWVTCAAGWLASTLVLPKLVAYHADYRFPLAFTAMIVAAGAVAAVYTAWAQQSRVLAWAWMGGMCLVNLPGLASHYADGSRIDVRTAARYVQGQWRPGDQAVGTDSTVPLLRYYAPKCQPVVSLSNRDPASSLRELPQGGPGRTWLVIQSWRAGLEPDVESWLGANCRHELVVRRTRFDYAENRVDVYRLDPPPPADQRK